MSAINVVAETDTTVTLSRRDFEDLLSQLEEVADRDAVASHKERVMRLGAKEARRLAYTAIEVDRMLDEGMSPLTVWRERAGLSGRALAAAARVSPSYLAEIEAGRKPGSVAAIKAIAAALRVPMEYLVPERQG